MYVQEVNIMISWLKMYLKVAWACKTPLVLILDTKYTPIPAETLKDIAEDIPEEFEYVKNKADCDDAAFLFKADASRKKQNAVGIIFGKNPRGFHAWNVALCGDSISEIEPQTGDVGKRPGYKPWFVII